MHTSYRGIAFLLSLGSLPLACSKDDNDTDDGGTSATGTGGATDQSSNTADLTTSTGGTTGTGGQTDTGSTTTQPTTTTPTSDGTDTSDTSVTTGGPEADPTCVAYAKHAVECDPAERSVYRDELSYCQYYKSYGFRADGQPCVDAFDALYVCLSTTECADLINPESGACEAEGSAISTACPTLGEVDTDTDTAPPTETSSDT